MTVKYNQLAEAEVIASITFSGEMVADLRSEMFGDTRYKRIFEILQTLHFNEVAITQGSVLAAILDANDKKTFTTLIMNSNPISGAMLATSIQSIRDYYYRRELERLGSNTLDKVYDATCNPRKLSEYMIEEAKKIAKLTGYKANLTETVREWIAQQSATFSQQFIYNELQIATSNEKAKIRTILQRLVEEGMIERTGYRAGEYRIKDQSIDYIEWEAASDDEMEFVWPLGIRSLFMLSPKNQIVIAGDTNSGKTAIGMNIAAMNAPIYPDRVWYFSSEMGEIELKRRIKMFEQLEAPYNVPRETWRGVKFIDRVENFHDVIRPNDINIIDYLEIHDDFWKVGKLCAEIHDRLENGIAVIFIQKKQGASYGFGGDKSLQKARLGINLVNDDGINRATIVKCKNMREGVTHAYGLEKEYYIIKGALIKDKGNWTFPTQAELEARKKRAMKQGGN